MAWKGRCLQATRRHTDIHSMQAKPPSDDFVAWSGLPQTIEDGMKKDPSGSPGHSLGRVDQLAAIDAPEIPGTQLLDLR